MKLMHVDKLVYLPLKIVASSLKVVMIFRRNFIYQSTSTQYWSLIISKQKFRYFFGNIVDIYVFIGIFTDFSKNFSIFPTSSGVPWVQFLATIGLRCSLIIHIQFKFINAHH